MFSRLAFRKDSTAVWERDSVLLSVSFIDEAAGGETCVFEVEMILFRAAKLYSVKKNCWFDLI